MRLQACSALLLAFTASASAASGSWSFQDATVAVSGKGAGVGGGNKEKLSPKTPLSSPVSISSGQTLKLLLTATLSGTEHKPEQATLSLLDAESGLEDQFPLATKPSGKAKLELSTKDLATQFLAKPGPYKASIIIGSPGNNVPLETHLFDLVLDRSAVSSPSSVGAPTRYGKLEEIHHIFRADPKSPPIFITFFFLVLVLAVSIILFGLWAGLGANFSQLSEALSNAPVSHALFFGSIIALEVIFGLYYSHWKLYQMLPAAGAAGLVAFLSGSRALSEVQGRRLSGKR